MARTGITYHDVAKAAQQLVGEQRNPTIESIRLVLKTGSSSTIAQHLRHWKAEQNSIQFTASQTQLPEELVALIQGLWDRVMAQARIEIENQQQQADEKIHASTAQYQALQHEHQQVQVRLQQRDHDYRQCQNDKLAIEQVLQKQLNENAALEATLRAHTTQLQDKQTQIDELKQIKQQLQRNLEHYRESVREQRAEQQKLQAQEIKQLEQALKQQGDRENDYKQQCQQLSDQLFTTQQNYHALSEKYDAISKQHHKLETEHRLLDLKCHQQTEAIRQYQQELPTLHDYCEKQKKQLYQLGDQLTQKEQRINGLTDQLEQNKQQHQTLAHEKWILGQEKAQLQGQLKQLEAMVLRTA